MIGKRQWVVLDIDEKNDVRAVYGPFAEQDDAVNWPGPPTGLIGGRSVRSMYEPPYWVEPPPEEPGA